MGEQKLQPIEYFALFVSICDFSCLKCSLTHFGASGSQVLRAV